MKTDQRSLRRHHLSRMKQKWRLRQQARALTLDALRLSRMIGLHANTGRLCSCRMCGNPRRYSGELSLQERRALAAERRDRLS